MPAAPGRLSTSTGWPIICDIAFAIIRAVLSVTPPAPNGTTQVIGRLGYVSAAAAGAATRRDKARLAIVVRCFMTLFLLLIGAADARSGDYAILVCVMPPSTAMICAVTKPLSSLARKH